MKEELKIYYQLRNLFFCLWSCAEMNERNDTVWEEVEEDGDFFVKVGKLSASVERDNKVILTSDLEGTLCNYIVSESNWRDIFSLIEKKIKEIYSNKAAVFWELIYKSFLEVRDLLELDSLTFATTEAYKLSSLKYLSDEEYDKEFLDICLTKEGKNKHKFIKKNIKNDWGEEATLIGIMTKIPTTLYEINLSILPPHLYNVFSRFKNEKIEITKPIIINANLEEQINRNYPLEIDFFTDSYTKNILRKLIELGYTGAQYHSLRGYDNYYLIDYLW